MILLLFNPFTYVIISDSKVKIEFFQNISELIYWVESQNLHIFYI